MEQNVIVLMSTYNGQQYLKEQLVCILQQTYKGHITVLIRDDGSSDGSGVSANASVASFVSAASGCSVLSAV